MQTQHCLHSQPRRPPALLPLRRSRTPEGRFAISSPNGTQGDSGTGTWEGTPRSLHSYPGLWLPDPCPSQRSRLRHNSGLLVGRIYCSRDGKETVLQDSHGSSLSPFRGRCFLAASMRRGPPSSPRPRCLPQLPKMFLGALASRHSVGAKSPSSPGILG